MCLPCFHGHGEAHSTTIAPLELASNFHDNFSNISAEETCLDQLNYINQFAFNYSDSTSGVCDNNDLNFSHNNFLHSPSSPPPPRVDFLSDLTPLDDVSDEYSYVGIIGSLVQLLYDMRVFQSESMLPDVQCSHPRITILPTNENAFHIVSLTKEVDQRGALPAQS